MSRVQHFSVDKMKFEPYGGPPGEGWIARLGGPQTSTSMGAGEGRLAAFIIETGRLLRRLVWQ